MTFSKQQLALTLFCLLIPFVIIIQVTAQTRTDCAEGFANEYPCHNVALLAYMPLETIGEGSGSDIWGWTDPETGTEYALMGRSNGTAFVDLSQPDDPRYLGNLPTEKDDAHWRDIKVYTHYAFIVSEATDHGIQIFDLNQLQNVTTTIPITFSATAVYTGFGNAHNIVINEESGFAYGVGTKTCEGGLHMVNIQDPLAPQFAGCFDEDGYTHDAQCVIYRGPDSDYQGHEICLNANEDTITIVDVTDKTNPRLISRTGYSGSYTHQGWLTADQSCFLFNDELDEIFSGHNTRTHIWSVADLDNPGSVGFHDLNTPSIDHNLYIHNNYVYEANYRSGLRILSLEEVNLGALTEVAYFDIYPDNDNPGSGGSWSSYPYFESGIVIVSGMRSGLFILEPTLPLAPPPPACDPLPPSPVTSFVPESILCSLYESDILPAPIGVTTTTTVTLLVEDAPTTIWDINVPQLKGSHEDFEHLNFKLVNPSGTTIQLMGHSCARGAGDFYLGLDDEASTGWACLPNQGTAHLPTEPLAAFKEEDPNGTWQLIIHDSNLDYATGSLDKWLLEVCTNTTHTIYLPILE